MIRFSLSNGSSPLSRILARLYTAPPKHLEPPIMSLRPFANLITVVALASSAFAQQSSQATTQGTQRPASGAPEIDVALTGAAIALVLGGLFIFTTARRKKLASS